MSEENLSKSNQKQPKEIQFSSNDDVALSPSATLNNSTKRNENSGSLAATKRVRRRRTVAERTGEPKQQGIAKVSIEKPLASPVSSPFNILDGSFDDSRIKIFEYLPLLDLCSVAEVCKVFHSNAVSVFSRFHRNFQLSHELLDDMEDKVVHWQRWLQHDWDEESQDEWEDESQNEWQRKSSLSPLIAKVFRNFGVHIRQLHLECEDLDYNLRDEILELMATYCGTKDSRLELLVVHYINIHYCLRERLQPVFDRLRYLDITGGSLGGSFNSAFYEFDSDLPQLNELILDDVDLTERFVRNFKKLRRISFIDVSFAGSFDSFVELNPQLKSLTIRDSDGQNTWLNTRSLSVIVSSLLKLEQLKLDTKLLSLDVHEVPNDMPRLQHLRVFSCDCLHLSIANLLNYFVEQTVPLEDLNLTNLMLNDNIATALSKLSQIKKLRFDGGEIVSGELLNVVVKGMPQLHKIHLVDFSNVVVEDFEKTFRYAKQLNELLYYPLRGEIVDIAGLNGRPKACNFLDVDLRIVRDGE